jgi:general secretion pathway protein I
VKRTNSGFTLIEVMIALAIFAVTASAIVLANIQTLQSTRQIQEQLEARMVNQNVLTLMRIEHSLPQAGTTKQDIEFNNKNWEVEIVTTNVEMELFGPFLRRIQLKATLENEETPADILEALLGEAGGK